MKIAQIAPLYEAVPPRLYGGTERIVAHLTDALVELGHEVTLFASAEARTRARLVPMRDQAIRLDPVCAQVRSRGTSLDAARAAQAARTSSTCCTSTSTSSTFRSSRSIAAQTVTTLHGRLDLKDLPEAYARWRDYPLVSISDDQRAPLPDANWLATIPHGLAESIYSFNGRARGSPPTLRSSAGSRRKSDPTGQSRSPSARACR